MRKQLTDNFVANFPELGEKMLGAMQMELDDLKGRREFLENPLATQLTIYIDLRADF